MGVSGVGIGIDLIREQCNDGFGTDENADDEM